jgi:hypothetical protein
MNDEPQGNEEQPLEGDALLRDLLKGIDQDPNTAVTSWEADFLENVLFRYTHGALSEKQRGVCHRIIHNYAPELAAEHGIPEPPQKSGRSRRGGERARPSATRTTTSRESTPPRKDAPKPW